MRRLRSVLLNALLVLVAVGATLGIALAADRWLGLGIGRALGLFLARNVQQPEPIMYVYDNRTGWRLNPLTQYHRERDGPLLKLAGLEPFDTRLRVNSEGFIDREHFLQTPYYRIAFVGNSWVEAVQQEYTDRFAPLTEDYVFEQSQHRKVVEIMNFGVSNLAPSQGYGVIKAFVLKYHPDEVWLFANAADLGSNSPLMTPPPFGATFMYADAGRSSLSDIAFGYVDPPAYMNWKRRQEMGKLMDAAPSMGVVLPYLYSNERLPVFDHVWEDMRLVVDLIHRTLAANGVRMRMVYLPASYEVNMDYWRKYQAQSAKAIGRTLPMDPDSGERRYAALASDLGIEFLSLLPLCREKGAQEMFADHFSRMGHHWVARYLADTIIRTTPGGIEKQASAPPAVREPK
jgi:hypothetical protein